MRYSDDIIEEVRQKNDIVDVVFAIRQADRKGQLHILDSVRFIMKKLLRFL